jgi:hypothetical protein
MTTTYSTRPNECVNRHRNSGRRSTRMTTTQVDEEQQQSVGLETRLEPQVHFFFYFFILY